MHAYIHTCIHTYIHAYTFHLRIDTHMWLSAESWQDTVQLKKKLTHHHMVHRKDINEEQMSILCDALDASSEPKRSRSSAADNASSTQQNAAVRTRASMHASTVARVQQEEPSRRDAHVSSTDEEDVSSTDEEESDDVHPQK